MSTLRDIGCALTLAVLAAPSAALAQRPACGEVDVAIQGANGLRQLGRDRAAVDALRPLLLCGPNPRLAATLGLAEFAAALWVPGYEHLSSALATSDPWVSSRRAALQSALDQARPHLGFLEVTANVPGAEVRIGGERIATLPMREPLRVAAGGLTYELRASGYVRELRRVEVAGNEVLTREHVLLAPEAAPARPAAPVVAEPAPVAARAAVPTPPPPAAPHPERPSNTQRVVGWSLLGVAAAGLGVGIWGTVARNADIEAFNLDTTCDNNNAMERMSARCQAAQENTDRMLPAMIAGYAVGGAAAITSVILLATAQSSAPRRAFGCAGGLGSIQCMISF